MSKLFLSGIILVPYVFNALVILKHKVCTHENKHQILVMRDGLQGREVLFRGFRLFGDILVSKGRGLRDLRMADGLMADGLVDAENWKGSGMPTGILETGSTRARTLPMASNRVLPEMLISSWLLAASETHRNRLDFLSTASFGAFV